jgi:pimeloyl-ACP methyl ester carboxylesterase
MNHQQIRIDGLGIHAVQAGTGSADFLFLHGWPEDWSVFEPIMRRIARHARVTAIDLPGIGASETPAPSGDKRALAARVRQVVQVLGLKDVVLVGHDVGGQIAYAYLRAFPAGLRSAIVMNVAIPGVEPWSEVRRNPDIWHFAFHAVPQLPEMLVAGRVAGYFDYFFDALAGEQGVSRAARDRFVRAYLRPQALRAGFEWYRGYAQDERDNHDTHGAVSNVPLLYVRGDQERGGQIAAYARGLRAAGIANLRTELIPGSGHFAPIEQPAATAAAIERFALVPERACGC